MPRRTRLNPRTSPGWRRCRYNFAPGRANWPSRDPIGESGGINIYAFVVNSPTNLVDPLGQNFIAVGSSPAVHSRSSGEVGPKFILPGFGHFMITYWEDTKHCIREGDVKHGNSISGSLNWTRVSPSSGRGGLPDETVPNDAAVPLSSVIQLGFDSNWETTYTLYVAFASGFNIGPYTIRTRPDVSLINKTDSDSDADQYVVLYADTKTKQDAKQKWDTIKNAAAGYAYAEHGPFVPGAKAKNWPNSHYGHLIDGNSNNSNTFIHEMARSISKTVPRDVWGGRLHLGNVTPQPVTDPRPSPTYKIK